MSLVYDKKLYEFNELAITGSIVIVVTGMLFGWATPSLPQLLDPKSEIKMSTSDGSWMAVMPCIGAVIGCFLAAKIVDNIGRKKSMLLVSPLYFIAWIMIAYSGSKYIFHAARILSGIADGIAFTTFPMYLGEIADSKIRGLLCSSIPITTVLGFMLIAIVGSMYSIKDAALISSVLPIVHFVLFSFMPESPYYLLMKNKPEQAQKSLIKLRGDQNVSEELERFTKSVKEDEENKGSIWDLFSVESNRKGVYIVVGLRGLQQFCGPMVITFYATIIFNESKSDLSSTTCTSIYFGIQVVCSIICSCLVDKIGRRPLLILSTIGSCIALAVQGGYFYIKDTTDYELKEYTWVPVAALLTYDVLFNLGIGTIPVMMLGELFPTSVKAFALCLADIYFGVVVIIATKFFQIMNDNMGMSIPFFVFSGCSAIALVYTVFCIPETKGKTLEEIQDYFKGIDKKQNVDIERTKI